MFLSPFFKVGDLIECESIRGRVEDIGLLHTRIRGMDNQLISTPNATFVSSEVTNFSRRERRGESFVSRTLPKLLTDPNFFLSFLFFCLKFFGGSLHSSAPETLTNFCRSRQRSGGSWVNVKR